MPCATLLSLLLARLCPRRPLGAVSEWNCVIASLLSGSTMEKSTMTRLWRSLSRPLRPLSVAGGGESVRLSPLHATTCDPVLSSSAGTFFRSDDLRLVARESLKHLNNYCGCAAVLAARNNEAL